MKKFIVIQNCVSKTETIGNTNNVQMLNIVRHVTAENKETAIGKFVIETCEIKYEKKLEIECYDLSKLKSID